MIIFEWIRSNDKFLVAPTLVCALTIIFILLNFFIILSTLPDQIPLFYSRPWGETQLADKWQFLILPASLGVMGLVNLILASQLHTSQKALKRTVMLTVVLLSFMILVTSVKILLIFV